MKYLLPTKKHQPQGFVILFVVLIAAIILLIGAGIFTISFKENLLSGTARESQLALDAADAGIECALYHDIQLLAFQLTLASIECVGESLDVETTLDGFSFTVPMDGVMNISGVNLPCAYVTVDKDWINPNDSQMYTRITSRGYNVCDNNGDPVVSDPLLLERVLDVKYLNPLVITPAALSTSTLPTISSTPSTSAAISADSISETRESTQRESSSIRP